MTRTKWRLHFVEIERSSKLKIWFFSILVNQSLLSASISLFVCFRYGALNWSDKQVVGSGCGCLCVLVRLLFKGWICSFLFIKLSSSSPSFSFFYAPVLKVLNFMAHLSETKQLMCDLRWLSWFLTSSSSSCRLLGNLFFATWLT